MIALRSCVTLSHQTLRLSSGASVSDAQQQAYRLAEKIRWNGCFYRKDIGYRAIARERGEG